MEEEQGKQMGVTEQANEGVCIMVYGLEKLNNNLTCLQNARPTGNHQGADWLGKKNQLSTVN